MRSSLSGAVAALACVSLSAAQSWKTIPTVEAYGQHYFYTNNGSQFFIKGVAYQQNYAPNGASASSTSYSDPLSDSSACARDIPYMSRIFTNTIRVYAIDPTKNHDACMAALASAGIYVFADLSEPSTSIQTDNPTWDVPLYQRYTSVVDALAKYQNVIGFFAGNEVVNRANESTAAAFVKAAVRDTKAYIRTKGYRTGLGIGYATSDVPNRNELASYFVCGDSSAHIDFWGYNVYSWCGESSIQESSYDTRAKYFADYPVPVFFAEYGCNQFSGSPYSRPFTEVAALFGSQLTPVFSGGIVFEYFNSQSNKYGLVEVSGASVSPYPDYTSLSAQLAKVTPSSTQKSAYTPASNSLACPAVGASWSATASPLPSPVNAQLCDCEAASYACNVASNDQTKYGDVFNYICSNDANACVGFTHNATTGAYGSISGCSPKVQLGWAMNRYYLNQNSNPSACAFSGLATTQAAATAASCTSLIKAAGTNGQGSVPSPTGGSSGGSGSGGSGSSGGSGAATSSGLAALAAGTPHSASEFGVFYMVAYSALALVSGLGMICL